MYIQARLQYANYASRGRWICVSVVEAAVARERQRICTLHSRQMVSPFDGLLKNAGVIVWQLNDCWPVTSWAIADYFVRAILTQLRYTTNFQQVASKTGVLHNSSTSCSICGRDPSKGMQFPFLNLIQNLQKN